jgi:integrase
MSRRSNGEGSIYQRGDGRWCASIRLGGKRRVVYGRSRQEVARRLADAQRAAHQGRLVAPSRLTVGAFLTMWLDAHSPALGPATRAGYEDVIRQHLTSMLGGMRLQALRPLHVVAWQAERRAAGVSAQRVATALKVLRTALTSAVRWDLVPTNPTTGVERPRAARPERAVWTEVETGRFVAHATGYTQTWDPLWLFLLGSGCRRGEALGLQWGDVDLEHGTVRIARAVQVVRNRAGVSSPKTPASVRSLTLPPFAVVALRVQRQRQVARRLAAGPNWHGDDFIFTTASGQHPLVSNLLKALQCACTRAAVPRLTLHQLRHQHATLAIRAGVDAKTVQRRLGHTSLTMTLGLYAHALPSGDQQAADALQASIGCDPSATTASSDDDDGVV